jgi:hypothetical protein
MPAIIILELQTDVIYTTFEKFIAPIHNLLIENNFRPISTDPSISAERTRRLSLNEMVFYNDETKIIPQNIRDLANKIKATRGRPRFIKKIRIAYNIVDL